MKRYTAIGAVLVLLAVAGWGLFWWLGRAELERGLDGAVAALGERGWTVTWEGREIDGFPAGYSVRLTNVTATDGESGFSVRLPWVSAETSGGNIVARLADSFEADIPAYAPAVPDAEAPAAPAVLATTGETRNMIAVLTGSAAEGTVELTADRVVWRVDDPATGTRLAQTTEVLTALLSSDGTGSSYRVQADRLGVGAEIPEGDGPPSTADATLQDVVLTGSTTLDSPAALAEMLYAGAPGQAEGTFEAGSAEVRVVSTGDAPGSLDWRAEGMSGTAMLESGRMELEGEARGNAWTLEADDPGAPAPGTVSAGIARALYAIPMAPSERPDEMAIRLELGDISADEAIWAQLDPAGDLPRDPASLLVDVTGTLRVTERIDRLTPGSEPPFEISTLAFRDISAEALGASVSATGELEIVQPLGLPLGTVNLRLAGVEPLVRSLGRSGVLPPEMVTMAEAILQVYLRPAEGENAWTAEVELTPEGPLVNGMPVR